jgi:hypothetical protein
MLPEKAAAAQRLKKISRAHHWSLDEYRLHPPISFLEDPFKHHPSIYIYVFLVVSFLQVFLLKPCINFTSLPCMLHALPISSS